MIAPPTEPTVVPSLLAADPSRLREQALEVVEAGARALHVDVMDGRFVAPHGFRPETVAMLRDALGDEVLLDVHLMVEQPERYLPAFADAGADLITVHVETCTDLEPVRAAGVHVGIAICPSTPLQALDGLGDAVDLVLCMTVAPGYGGQRFIEVSPARVGMLAALHGPELRIEVDGGINAETGRACADAGAHLLVAGSAIFEAASPGDAYRELAHAFAKELA
jgi:ribulose-phosphate 3-epimerase